MSSTIDEHLERIAEQVRSSETVKLTPRDLLQLFGAKRRGSNVVDEMRARLALHHLATEPDFAEVGADEPVSLVLLGDFGERVDRLEDAHRRAHAEGSEPVRISVHTLLSWFGAERRGAAVCEQIRSTLAGFDLTTEPDFQDIHINDEVALVAAPAPEEGDDSSSADAPPPTPDVPEPTPVTQQRPPSSVPLREPAPRVPAGGLDTFRVGTLVEAKREVIHVKPQTPLRDAVTTMLIHQVSHLPILRSDFDVKGVLRWKDIGSYLLLSPGASIDDPVDAVMKPHREVRVSDPFLAVIPEILEHGCVLVRDKGRITGIITKKDLGRRLQEQARPFVTLGDIERCLRALIERGEFTSEELRSLALNPSDERKVRSVADLTLGEYQRLLERDEAWARVGLTLPKKLFLERLGEVRKVRNNIMHFDPEGATSSDHAILHKFLELMYSLRQYWET
jgi:CBS domain-containing protein